MTALLVFLTCSATNLLAAVVTFDFGGSLFQVGGPSGLAAGDPFTGSFSYRLEQQGVNVPLVVAGQETRYVLDQYTLTIRNQTVSASGGQLDISNDQLPWPSTPNILWDTVELGFGVHAGTPLSCSLNNIPITDLSFRLVNTAGQPFSDTSLPTTLPLSYFQASAYMNITFAGQAGSAIGQVTSLQLVPEPTVAGLLVLAAVAFAARRRFGKPFTSGTSR